MPYNFSASDMAIDPTKETTRQEKYDGSWKGFKVIGDAYQGTYIDKIDFKRDQKVKFQNQDGSVVDKIIKVDDHFYVLLTENNEYWFIGSRPIIDRQMKDMDVRFGQIVEFKYVGDRPSSNPSYSPQKVVGVSSKKEVVNSQWVTENQDKIASQQKVDTPMATDTIDIKDESSTFGKPPFESAPTPTTLPPTISPSSQVISDNKLDVIKTMAIEKLKALPTITQQELEKVVMVNTGIAFIEPEYDRIIEKLKLM